MQIPKPPYKAVIYGRVSTKDQDYESQMQALREAAQYNGCNIVAEFGEYRSGRMAAFQREEFAALRDYVINNNVKVIMVYSISRLGRDNMDVRNTIDFFRKEGVNIFILNRNMWSLNKTTWEKDMMMNLVMGLLSDLSEIEIEERRKAQEAAFNRNYKDKDGRVRSHRGKVLGNGLQKKWKNPKLLKEQYGDIIEDFNRGFVENIVAKRNKVTRQFIKTGLQRMQEHDVLRKVEEGDNIRYEWIK